MGTKRQTSTSDPLQNSGVSGANAQKYKWLGFRISNPIPNPDHMQPNLFLTIQNPD